MKHHSSKLHRAFLAALHLEHSLPKHVLSVSASPFNPSTTSLKFEHANFPRCAGRSVCFRAAVARAPKLLVPHPPSSNKSAAHEYKSAETTKPTMKPELADRLKLDLSAVLARNALGGTEDRSQPAGMPTERAHTPATRRISMHGVTETTGSKFPSTARVGADGDGATANPPRPPPLVTGVRPSTTRTACAHASVSRTEQVKKANSNSNSDAISKPTANAHVHVHAHTHRATSSPCVRCAHCVRCLTRLTRYQVYAR